MFCFVLFCFGWCFIHWSVSLAKQTSIPDKCASKALKLNTTVLHYICCLCCLMHKTCRWNIFHEAQPCEHWQSANKEDFLPLHFNEGYQCLPTSPFPSLRYSTACQEESFEDAVNVLIRALPLCFIPSCQTKEWTSWRYWSVLPGGLCWAWISQLQSKWKMKGLRNRECSFRFLQHQKEVK